MSDPLREGTYGRLVAAAVGVEKINPRVRMAARLWATGGAPTKAAAARAVGLNKTWFTLMTNHNEQVKRLVNDIDARIEDESADMSAVLRTLGRKAIAKISNLMQTAGKEEIQFKAAVDLADRSTETSKIQKLQIESMQISSTDAKELAKSLVEAAKVSLRFKEAVAGDFVKVDSSAEEPIHAKTGQLRGASEEPVHEEAHSEADTGAEDSQEDAGEHEAPRKEQVKA